LPPTDPQYHGIQGFSFGDFPPLGGEVSKNTTSDMTIGAKETPSRDTGNVKTSKKETELEGGVAPDPKGKAKRQRLQWRVFLTFLLPSCQQKRRQPLRSRSGARLPSADSNLALRTWPRATPQSSGVSCPPRVREKPGCTMSPMGTGLKICKPCIGVPCATRLLPVLIGSGGTFLPHGRSSSKFGLPDPCPLTCPPHAICLLSMRKERAR
jgi:hypothetical protein